MINEIKQRFWQVFYHGSYLLGCLCYSSVSPERFTGIHSGGISAVLFKEAFLPRRQREAPASRGILAWVGLWDRLSSVVPFLRPFLRLTCRRLLPLEREGAHS